MPVNPTGTMPSVSESLGPGFVHALESTEVMLAFVLPDGRIQSASRSWQRFGMEERGAPAGGAIGSDYLHAMQAAAEAGDPFAGWALDGFRSVLAGTAGAFSMEYPVRLAGGDRWFLLWAQPAAPAGVSVCLLDLAAPMLADSHLAGARARYEAVVRSCGVGAWEWELASGRVRVDPSLAMLLGYADGNTPTAIGEWLRREYAEQSGALMGRALRQLAGDGSGDPIEHRKVSGDGEVRWFASRGWVTRDGDGRPLSLVVLVSDVTARRDAEQAAARDAGRYRRLFDGVGVAIWEVDLSVAARLAERLRARGVRDARGYLGRHPMVIRRMIPKLVWKDANPEAVRLLEAGTTAKLLSLPIDRVLVDASRHLVDYIVSILDDRLRYEAPAVLRTLAGEERRVILTVCATDGAAGERHSALVCARDLTGLTEDDAYVRGLAGRLIGTQEEERRRVARELHDDVMQRLAVLSNLLDETASRMRRANKSVRALIGSAQSNLTGVRQTIRDVSHAMHPATLEHAGLVPALASLTHELQERGEVDVEADLTAPEHPLPPEVALALYRVAQEALRNVAQHSGTRRASVRLATSDDGAVTLTVRDEGVGFDPDTIPRTRGLGLISIHERARLVGGEASIASKPGIGTEVRVSVPAASLPE